MKTSFVDYETLYALVVSGEKIPCWIDYKFGKNYDKTARDICYCSKRKNGEINFSARGTGYGSTDDFLELEDIKKAFIKACECLNVEWIV